jgi:uncharacterized protein YihD (DUF1040 family)
MILNIKADEDNKIEKLNKTYEKDFRKNLIMKAKGGRI